MNKQKSTGSVLVKKINMLSKKMDDILAKLESLDDLIATVDGLEFKIDNIINAMENISDYNVCDDDDDDDEDNIDLVDDEIGENELENLDDDEDNIQKMREYINQQCNNQRESSDDKKGKKKLNPDNTTSPQKEAIQKSEDNNITLDTIKNFSKALNTALDPTTKEGSAAPFYKKCINELCDGDDDDVVNFSAKFLSELVESMGITVDNPEEMYNKWVKSGEIEKMKFHQKEINNLFNSFAKNDEPSKTCESKLGNNEELLSNVNDIIDSTLPKFCPDMKLTPEQKQLACNALKYICGNDVDTTTKLVNDFKNGLDEVQSLGKSRKLIKDDGDELLNKFERKIQPTNTNVSINTNIIIDSGSSSEEIDELVSYRNRMSHLLENAIINDDSSDDTSEFSQSDSDDFGRRYY